MSYIVCEIRLGEHSGFGHRINETSKLRHDTVPWRIRFRGIATIKIELKTNWWNCRVILHSMRLCKSKWNSMKSQLQTTALSLIDCNIIIMLVLVASFLTRSFWITVPQPRSQQPAPPMVASILVATQYTIYNIKGPCWLQSWRLQVKTARKRLCDVKASTEVTFSLVRFPTLSSTIEYECYA